MKKTHPFDAADYLTCPAAEIAYVQAWQEDGTAADIERAIGTVMRARFNRALREEYGAVLTERIPDDLRKLVERLK